MNYEYKCPRCKKEFGSEKPKKPECPFCGHVIDFENDKNERND